MRMLSWQSKDQEDSAYYKDDTRADNLVTNSKWVHVNELRMRTRTSGTHPWGNMVLRLRSGSQRSVPSMDQCINGNWARASSSHYSIFDLSSCGAEDLTMFTLASTIASGTKKSDILLSKQRHIKCRLASLTSPSPGLTHVLPDLLVTPTLEDSDSSCPLPILSKCINRLPRLNIREATTISA